MALPGKTGKRAAAIPLPPTKRHDAGNADGFHRLPGRGGGTIPGIMSRSMFPEAPPGKGNEIPSFTCRFQRAQSLQEYAADRMSKMAVLAFFDAGSRKCDFRLPYVFSDLGSLKTAVLPRTAYRLSKNAVFRQLADTNIASRILCTGVSNDRHGIVRSSSGASIPDGFLGRTEPVGCPRRENL